MVEVKPFKGTLYNREKVDNMTRVLCPPYDVISGNEQDIYYNNSEHNIIRIVLGKEEKGDDGANKYTRAQDYFKEWVDEKILVDDKEDTIYLYEEEFDIQGARNRRRGFICLMKLAEYEEDIVLPHEQTMKAPKEDRLSLMESTKVDLEPIFTIFHDTHNSVGKVLDVETKKEPVFDVVDTDENRHRIWRITDAKTIKTIQVEMSDKKVLIADGHHRYETALDYRNQHPDNKAAGYTMTLMVSANDPGLKILPIHRMVRNIKNLDLHEFERALLAYFDMEIFQFETDNEFRQKTKMFERMSGCAEKDHVLGMFAGKNRFYALTLKQDTLVDDAINSTRSRVWRELDITVLHSIVLDRILGLENAVKGVDIDFTDEADEAIQRVYSQEFQLAFFLNPTRIDDMIRIAEKGELMPQKSTFFYPKPLSGLVMNKLY